MGVQILVQIWLDLSLIMSNHLIDRNKKKALNEILEKKKPELPGIEIEIV